MKSLTIEVPDRLAEEMGRMVREGWYGSEAELARVALGEFVRTRHAELQERFQRDDIAWAVAEAKPANR
jgi:Arc/MetJ-type ribon-helix-helix transcriptional regulator